MRLLVVLALTFLPVGPNLSVSPDLPHHGESVVFSGAFPQEAFRQSRQPQYPGNPQLSLLCANTTTTVLRGFYFGIFTKTDKNPDGSWNAVSAPVVLDSNGGNGVSWPADTIGVVCTANTGYWRQLCAKCGPTWFPVGAITFAVGA